jgi:hypothetical protein
VRGRQTADVQGTSPRLRGRIWKVWLWLAYAYAVWILIVTSIKAFSSPWRWTVCADVKTMVSFASLLDRSCPAPRRVLQYAAASRRLKPLSWQGYGPFSDFPAPQPLGVGFPYSTVPPVSRPIPFGSETCQNCTYGETETVPEGSQAPRRFRDVCARRVADREAAKGEAEAGSQEATVPGMTFCRTLAAMLGTCLFVAAAPLPAPQIVVKVSADGSITFMRGGKQITCGQLRALLRSQSRTHSADFSCKSLTRAMNMAGSHLNYP